MVFSKAIPKVVRGVIWVLTLLSGPLYVSAQTLYVWPESPTPTPPYTNWDTAAHDLQEAVDAAVEGDTVLVTNGVYGTGGRALVGMMTNRVVIDKAIRVQSVGGPEVNDHTRLSIAGGDQRRRRNSLCLSGFAGQYLMALP